MKKIMVFTGSRADYGLLKNLLKRVNDNKNYKLDIVASSIHFMKKSKAGEKIQSTFIRDSHLTKIWNLGWLITPTPET